MPWIEIHQALPTHRKTLALADALGIEPPHAVGYLTCLWLWSLDNAPEGDLSHITTRMVARAAQWGGDADLFFEALTIAGFVDPEQRIHDWEEYAGRLIEKRKANAERMRRAREQHDERTESDRATHVQRTSGARAGATVPDSTGDTPQSPTVTAPQRGGTPRAKGVADEPDDGNLAPLFEAFTALGLPRPIMAGKKGGSEAGAARALLKHFPPGELAQCWQDIASGEYGDAFAQRDLSFGYLANRNRVANWQAWKARPHDARAAPVHANGRAPRPEAEHRWVDP